MRRPVLFLIQIVAMMPLGVHADDSQWLAAARNALEPALSAEYGREITGVVAYAGNQSAAQIVTLAFPLTSEETADWQQRFASVLESAGAAKVNVSDVNAEVEGENIPAAPKPMIRVSCATGEHEGRRGVVCTAIFLNL